MQKLNRLNLKQLLLGTTLLSTGGGGQINNAQKILKKITKIPKLISLNELKPQDLVVTLVGVGDKDVCDPIACSLNALRVYQKLFRKKIKAIIPVELGPLSTLTAVFLAGRLGLPVVDADIVGFRASPDVFLETITLAKLPREPIVMANDKKDILILYQTSSIGNMEQSLRDFAVASGGDAYGVGYPLTVKQIKNVVGIDSLTASIKLGVDLIRLKNDLINLEQFCQNNQLVFLGQGKIISAALKSKQGFIQGKYKVGNNFVIFVKNENIALLKNNLPVLTVPDSILIIDLKKFTGINNQENNLGKDVIIFGKKAIPIWRTKAGINLFSPKNLGYNIKQKLL